MDQGLLLIRLVVGGLLAGHGIQKLFGRLGGFGIAGTAGYLESHGFRPGRLFAALAGIGELAGGTLLVAGLATPLAALLIASVMIVASRTDHAGKGIWITNGGSEYTLTVAAVALGLVIVGPGTLSLDRLLGLEFSGLATGLVTFLVAMIVAASVLAMRSRGMARSAAEGHAVAGQMTDNAAM